MPGLIANYEKVKNDIETACINTGRDMNEITLVAVSKTFPAEDILNLNKHGHRDFGENKVQELNSKNNELQGSEIKWHMIGHLQTNKVKYIAEYVSLIHSVDSVKLAAEIDKQAVKHERNIDILLQVNTSGEDQKSGMEPADTMKNFREINRFENITVSGLMTIGKLTEDKKIIRDNFRMLREIFEELKVLKKEFKYLSMGMTSDFETAIEEGSNILRIGSAIFGERNYKTT